MNDILLPELLWVLAKLLLLTAVVWGALLRWLRDVQRASFVTMLLFFGFSYFGAVNLALKALLGVYGVGWLDVGIGLVWTSFFVFLTSSWLWKRLTKPQVISTYMGILGLVLFAMQIATITQFYLAGRETVFTQPFTHPRLAATESQPDIYYIILDGYSRQDVLQDIYGLDNTEFVRQLQARGFYLPAQSQSNYIHTVLSLSSSLNLDYLPEVADKTIQNRTLLRPWIQDSALWRSLQAIGYRRLVLPSGYQYTNTAAALPPELAAHYRANSGYLEMLWMLNSFLRPGLDLGWYRAPADYFQDQQNRILSGAEFMGELAAQPGPKFVFWHLIVPHPPFIFGADGPAAQNLPYILVDSKSMYPSSQVYIEGYRGQLAYTNQLILRVIDDILANSATPPLIIVQGDHGGGAYLDWESQQNTCLYERFGILNAYLLPGVDAQAVLYDEISPVNSFRQVLNVYFDAGLELRPDQQFFSTFEQPYDYQPVNQEQMLEACVFANEQK